MEYNPEEKEIISNKELNELDKFVIDFCSYLDEYVIVSGYVSILLGRSRATEDVDLLIPSMSKEEFEILWDKLHNNDFECMNTSDPGEAFKMLKEHAIRFFKRGKPTPNIEFKIIKNDLDKYAYENKLRVILTKGELFISPLESQIPYKLFLAADGADKELQSDKDIEDARHLYKLFEQKLNKEELLFFINKLKVDKKLKFLK
ncbi:MAG: hypothetical protein PHH54_01020 [Candidatus Nanoarchaeia archaeon]|nr:hypothetical protein [Candidatus Nanoarchaeia archaeon]MDD5740545.1 hypothetical protein [Candidatus Nanoarchaeia archaeon]